MRDAAALLVGTHDFGSFQTNPDMPAAAEDAPDVTADRFGPAAASGAMDPPPWRKPRPRGTVRTITRAELLEDGDLLNIEVEGNGFLRGMVRALAGTLVDVGLGKQPPGWVAGLLREPDRREAGANLPPHALTLVRVHYPPEPFLGQDSTDGLALV
jgi:tRNA U38,U39,U40 pseudouridine synthase TruA